MKLLDVLGGAPGDYNVALTVQWLFDFREHVPAHFARLHGILMGLSVGKPLNVTWELFGFSSRYLVNASVDDLLAVIKNPSYTTIESFLIPSARERCFSRLTDALVEHLDDDVCRAEAVRVFTRAVDRFGWPQVSTIHLSFIEAVVPVLPDAVLEHFIVRISEVLAWRPHVVHRRDEYVFALGSCRALIPRVGTGPFGSPVPQVIEFAEMSADSTLTTPVTDFIAAFAGTMPADRVEDLIERCNAAVNRGEVARRLYVPIVVRLTLMRENPEEGLWQRFTRWALFPVSSSIINVGFAEMARLRGEVVNRVLIRMCAVDGWKNELKYVTRVDFVALVTEMSDSEVLDIVFAIVGDREVVMSSIDWELLSSVVQVRTHQKEAICEILSPRKPPPGVCQEYVDVIFDDLNEDEFEVSP
jgi:hypothetical protein